jgi:hypothetical protein
MSIVRALVNQIGREVGRDVYRNIKNSAANSSSASRLTGNILLIREIEEFKISKYPKVTGTNIQLLFNKLFKPNSINNRCFFFDDVYIAFISLLERIEKTSDKFEFSNVYEVVDNVFKNAIKIHILWVEDEILMKETDITLEEANIKVYELKGFFAKMFHKKKPSVSKSNIAKLKEEVRSLKSHVDVMKNFKLI